jgi:hypothetical protein
MAKQACWPKTEIHQSPNTPTTAVMMTVFKTNGSSSDELKLKYTRKVGQNE